MLNAASAMDAAVLVVAANEECPRPQTAEHLAAADLMNLGRYVVIQNKVDLVSEEDARKSYLVADHTKFKMVAPVRIASLAELDGFFTDIQPPKSVIQLCADNDVFIRTVEAAARAR